MAGARGGVATKMQEIEPRAVFTHCYGHALNLSVKDTITGSASLKDCLDTCFELIKLIKFSPKREGMLNRIKEETGSESPSIRTMCPTRWTVRADALASILSNYNDIQKLWEDALEATSDTEMKARIQGISSQMTTFPFLFNLLLSEIILRHTDKLSQSLQKPTMSSVEGHEIAMLTVKTLQGMHSDRDFNLFWDRIETSRIQYDVEEATLPRRRKRPHRYGDGEATFPATPKDLYRPKYFEVLDLAVMSIMERFNQPGFKVYSNLEQLLFKACSGEEYDSELSAVCEFYGEDLNPCDLQSQLRTLRTLYLEKKGDEKPSISGLKFVLQSLSPAQRTVIDMVCRTFQLLIVTQLLQIALLNDLSVPSKGSKHIPCHKYDLITSWFFNITETLQTI